MKVRVRYTVEKEFTVPEEYQFYYTKNDWEYTEEEWEKAKEVRNWLSNKCEHNKYGVEVIEK